MAKRQKAPSRVRYESQHPSLTVRVPAEVKAKVRAAAEAEGLSVSEWVQAVAAGHAPDVTAAYEKGRAVGRQAGEAAGYRRGKRDGQSQGAAAGFAAGLLQAVVFEEQGKQPSLQWAAAQVTSDEDRRRIAEELAEHHGWARDLARLLRQAASAGR